jgi:hypothetical protein
MAVRVKLAVIWTVVLFGLVAAYQHFRGPCSLCNEITLMIEAAATSETLVGFARLHDAITLKKAI